MRIGIVLNRYPVHSETFIETFLNHLSGSDVILYAKITDKTKIANRWNIKPYLRGIPAPSELHYWLTSLALILIYHKRFIFLKKAGVPIRQLIADAPIWTTSNLDILHFPFGNSAIGRELYASLLNAKMTVSFRGSDINVFPIFNNCSYISIWPYVHSIHCNSKELANKLQRHNLPSDIPITIIPAALRKEIQTINIKKSTFQQLAGLSAKNPLIITTIGRLHWIKDYPLAIRTIYELKRAQIHIKYYILGDGPEKEHLMFLIHELNLQNEISLLGKASINEIQNHLATSHVYLQTSLAEGFSNACLEAQAFGLPCVVPSISGMDACVEHGQTGMIVRSRKEEEFASSIQYILKNRASFDADYIAGRVKHLFSLEEQRNLWLNFFQQVLTN